MNFNALLVTKDPDYKVQLEKMDESCLRVEKGDEVLVEIKYSSLNYKDALALTGKDGVVRQFPMVPGIDLAGIVRESSHSDFREGDEVVSTGHGLGETHWGGLAQLVHLPASWLVHLPAQFTLRQAMSIGTAGFTAMQCILAIKRQNVNPEDGNILVTGASGGVGSLAVTLLSRMGYQVTASTGRMAEADYLRELGATDVVDRQALSLPSAGKPLGKATWAGAVDTVGSHSLANVCATLKLNGAVAACGLVGGADFSSTVMPFILRGITLCGINSTYVSLFERMVVWQNLQKYLNLAHLEKMTREISLFETLNEAPKFLEGKTRGRIVVNVSPL